MAIIKKLPKSAVFVRADKLGDIYATKRTAYIVNNGTIQSLHINS